MEPVRFGIIGLGNMGADHARKVEAGKAEGAVLAAICDINAEKREKLAAELGVPAFDDYKKMVDSGLCEAVIVATPHYWHAPMTIYAAQQRLHVMCEKPISVTKGIARLMVEECERAGVKLGIMFMQRFRPTMRKMRQNLACGQLGEVFRVSMVASSWLRNQSYYNSGGWRGTWSGEGGGILMNQAPHSLDLFILMAGGLPKRVTASVQTRVHDIEVENTANAVLDYGDGKMSYIYATTAEAPGVEELTISGNKGTAVIHGNTIRLGMLERPLDEHLLNCPEGFKRPQTKWEEIKLDGVADPSHMGVLAQFVKAIRQGEAPTASGQDGINEIELCDAIYMAGFSGLPVDLPLKEPAVEGLIDLLIATHGRKGVEDVRTPATADLRQILKAAGRKLAGLPLPGAKKTAGKKPAARKTRASKSK